MMITRIIAWFFFLLQNVKRKSLVSIFPSHNPASIYLFKVNNGNTRTMCEICSKLTITIPKQNQWRRSGVFIVNFEQISHIVLVVPLLALNNQMPAGTFLKKVFRNETKTEPTKCKPQPKSFFEFFQWQNFQILVLTTKYFVRQKTCCQFSLWEFSTIF